MKWFNEKEFACTCCGQLPLFARENVEALVREVLGPNRHQILRKRKGGAGYELD